MVNEILGKMFDFMLILNFYLIIREDNLYAKPEYSFININSSTFVYLPFVQQITIFELKIFRVGYWSYCD